MKEAAMEGDAFEAVARREPATELASIDATRWARARPRTWAACALVLAALAMPALAKTSPPSPPPPSPAPPAIGLSPLASRGLGANVALMKLCGAMEPGPWQRWKQDWRRQWQDQPDRASRDALFQQGQDEAAAEWPQLTPAQREQACDQIRQQARQLQGIAERSGGEWPAMAYDPEQIADMAGGFAMVERCKAMSPERIERWRQAQRSLAGNVEAFDQAYERGRRSFAARLDAASPGARREVCAEAAALASRLEAQSHLLEPSPP